MKYEFKKIYSDGSDSKYPEMIANGDGYYSERYYELEEEAICKSIKSKNFKLPIVDLFNEFMFGNVTKLYIKEISEYIDEDIHIIDDKEFIDSINYYHKGLKKIYTFHKGDFYFCLLEMCD